MFVAVAMFRTPRFWLAVKYGKIESSSLCVSDFDCILYSPIQKGDYTV